ncbi:unnamed protein product, partial [Ectocarpus sp. 12 AP-2014]
ANFQTKHRYKCQKKILAGEQITPPFSTAKDLPQECCAIPECRFALPPASLRHKCRKRVHLAHAWARLLTAPTRKIYIDTVTYESTLTPCVRACVRASETQTQQPQKIHLKEEKQVRAEHVGKSHGKTFLRGPTRTTCHQRDVGEDRKNDGKRKRWRQHPIFNH